jgi:hypothetical protein
MGTASKGVLDVTKMNTIFCDLIPCSLVEIY